MTATVLGSTATVLLYSARHLRRSMLIHELTPDDCREILSRTTLGRLACARADQPYVVPVSFAYDRAVDSLFSFSAIGKKIEWMRDNPKVCVEIDDVSDRFHWTTVVIFGRYVEISSSTDDEPVRERARRLFERREEWLGAAEALLESELFGHERGAFTGADRQKRGLLESGEGARSFSTRSGRWRPCAPSFDVPDFVLKRLLKRDSGQMIEGLRQEIAARASR